MLVAGIAALALAAQPVLPLRPCVVQGVSARCGTLAVPENRALRHGRTIRLSVVVIPARSKPARPDAFTFVAGGPGDAAATMMPSSALGIWPGVHERHDIVLVDQRGTGGSHPIVCTPPSHMLRTQAEKRAYVRGCIRAVRADPTQYGTRQAVDDLEAVRAALGYRQLDVYGTSYGATVAQMYLSRYPRSVRTMILDGATFVDVPFYSRFAANAQHALELLTARCSADRMCARAFPHWRDRLASLIAQWNEHPARLPDKSRITGDGLAGVVQSMLLVAGNAASIPLVVSRAAANDLEPLSHFVGSGGISTSLMFWTIMCNEPWVGLGARGPWHTEFDGLARAALAQMHTACAYMPRAPQPASAWRRPHSTVPLLALVGEADPQDPIGNLPGLGRSFPNSRVVTAPAQGHAVGQYGCLGRIVARFVDRASVRGLATGCARDIPPPVFATR